MCGFLDDSDNLTSTPQSSDLSVFETNIRFVGGLLSAYALTGDQVRDFFFGVLIGQLACC